MAERKNSTMRGKVIQINIDGQEMHVRTDQIKGAWDDGRGTVVLFMRRPRRCYDSLSDVLKKLGWPESTK